MWFSLVFSVFSELDDQLIFIFTSNHLIQNSSYVKLNQKKRKFCTSDYEVMQCGGLGPECKNWGRILKDKPFILSD